MAYRSGELFTVLVVGSANTCRSPAVEHLLHQALHGRGVAVHSAGTRAREGMPIQPLMAQLLERQGENVTRFRTRPVTEPMLAGADLILTATRDLRGDAADMLPSSVRRTFTVRELARLAESIDRSALIDRAGPDAGLGERLDALVPLAAAHRHAVPVELDDILDPCQADGNVYKESFAQIAEAVEIISRLVLEPHAQPPRRERSRYIASPLPRTGLTAMPGTRPASRSSRPRRMTAPVRR